MKNRILIPFYLFFILLTCFSVSIPFFWDGTFFSKISLSFFNDGFNYFIPPPDVDTGGFPLYSIYIAICWKLFSKSLLVSHFAMLPFLLGITYEYFKLAKRFLSGTPLIFAMLLLIVEPCFVTQSILMGYDLLLIYFFLLSLNTLLNDKKYVFQIAITFLCLSSVRGLFLGFSLMIIDVFLNKKITFLALSKYLLASVVLSSWMFYHFYKTSWFVINPIRETTHEALVSGSMMLNQFVYLLWKINDFGRIILWLLGFVLFYKIIKNKVVENKKTVLAILFIPLFVSIFCMIPLGNPIGHKYFIVVFLILNIAFCFALQQIKSKKNQTILFSISAIVLITGNFWLYNPKYGNGWDSSLKVISCFDSKKQMDEFILEQNILPLDVGTQFPLIANKTESDLTEYNFQYQNVWSGPIKCKYFLYSNIINTDIYDQFENVKKAWKPIKNVKSGLVVFTLYENPNY